MTTTAAAKQTCAFTNPQTLFADLKHQRDRSSIEYSPALNAHIVTKYTDILSILSNPETFTSKDATVPPFPPPIKHFFANRVPEGGTLLGWDNPDHDRLRSAVSGFFIPRKLERFRPLMGELAHGLVDGFVGDGKVDIKSAFALPLPLKLIVAIAGLDRSRWKWIGRCLTLFGGITARPGDGDESIETQVQDVLDLHHYVAEVIQERKYDRRDDLISYIWDQRDSGVQMTDFEHLSMIPGLLLAGHETTTSVLSMGLSHLLHHGLWDSATEDETTTAQAIEELLRYESAITGMFRLVQKETTVGAYTLNPGDRVFLAYSSGSRDESIFECPEKLQLQRNFSTQHLGFGRGIHACLGAPLARLLLKVEFGILRERLPNLRLATPYEDIVYEKVGPSRGVERVLVAWDPPKDPWVRTVQVQVTPSKQGTRAGNETIQAVVEQLSFLTDEILEVTLSSKSMILMPPWEPGSHIEILSEHGYRQYSLCSDPEDRSHWKIAILREDTGSGGSRWFHENLRKGAEVTVRTPRNHFRLKKSYRYVFIAGGIGITPLKPMLAQAKRQCASYTLVYLGRSRKTMAYLDELARNHPVDIWAGDEGNRFDLERFAREQDETVQVYCCGPERLLSSLEEACKSNLLIELHVERFQGLSSQSFLPNRFFDVVLNRSGRTMTVNSEKTLLETLNANGCGIMSTCSKGTCGTCEVSVLEGIPEHRDTVLSLEEKGENRVMMPCVSRSASERLVLDLW